LALVRLLARAAAEDALADQACQRLKASAANVPAPVKESRHAADRRS
jgi:RIO-like serine/threonine protein kinase